MFRIWKASAIVLAAVLALAPMASAQPPRVVVRRQVFIWAPYDPFWGPWGPPYPYTYVPAPYSGDVKLKTDMKDASVYVDGGYAGKASKLKRFSLRAGTHDIELRDSEGHTFFRQRIQVIVGKTTEVDVGRLNG